MNATSADIRGFIFTKLEKQCFKKGIDFETLPEDVSLFELEVLSSLEFLELVTAVELEFGLEIDFSVMDPDEFTTIQGLLQLIATATPVGE